MSKMPLRIVVIGGVIIGLVLPLAIAAYYSSARQKTRLMAQAEAAHIRATNILAFGVSKALWDLSPEAAAPLVKSLMSDERIVRAVIFDSEGAIFYEEIDNARRLGTIVSLEQDIYHDEQAIGKTYVEFSLRQAEEEIFARIFEIMAVSAIQALVCIAILVALINRRVLGRIAKLKHQARLLANKSLDDPFIWREVDEIGELGVCLESTRLALKLLFEQLELKNQELAKINTNLELIVAERTATIQMILDNVKFGFLLVDKSLVIQEGYTRSCESLTGQKNLCGRNLTEVLGMDDNQAAHFRVGVAQIFDDIFPESVSLEQIPRRFRVGGRSLSIEGATIRSNDGRLTKLLFTIIDISLLEQSEKENRTNRAMLCILQNIGAFREFITESRQRLAHARDALVSHDEASVRRELHTLKGNSAAFGLDELANLVHKIEDEVEIASDHLLQIETSYNNFLIEQYELLKIRFDDEQSTEGFTVTLSKCAELYDSVVKAPSVTVAGACVELWAYENHKVPIASLLGPLGSYIATLAIQRGKKVQFRLEGEDIRVEATYVKPIMQNLIHLLRNAIDHGIELPEERNGKPEEALLMVSVSLKPAALCIEVSDDGCGIDDQKIRAKAVTMGIISEEESKQISREKAVELIFAKGLSTADQLTDTSGRGVGMDAVKVAVETAGGSLTVRSQCGKGTVFRIDLPIPNDQGNGFLRRRA